MFDEIRDCLDEFEEVYEKPQHQLTEEEVNIVRFLDLHLAEAIMKSFTGQGESIAKVIMAYLGISNEIKVRMD